MRLQAWTAALTNLTAKLWGLQKKAKAKGQLAHQAVLKIPHKLLEKMSVEEQAAIIIEVAKGLEELYKQVDEAGEGEEGIPAYSDEDMSDAE